MRLNTAVLFLVFNRPDTTARVFDAIRQARPARLYVAADGAREDREGEAERCAEVRRIAADVDWPCTVETLFRDENLGCRLAISGAIDWFFDHEEEGIILEDDCLPHPHFFRYAEELLEKYRDDERIMTISAQHFHRAAHRPRYSYFFSRYNHCWGWASWRRAWKFYDRDMVKWPALRETNWLLPIGHGSTAFQRYWSDVFDMAYVGKKVDSWAYRWTFSCWAQDGLAVLPSVNLVTNIGFDANATHTGKGNAVLENLPLEPLRFPLHHPEEILCDVAADRWSDRHVFRFGGIHRIRTFLKTVLGERRLANIARWSRRWFERASRI